MRLANRVVSGAHVERSAAILKQRSRRMIGKIGFDDLGQPDGRRSCRPSAASGGLLLSGPFAGVHDCLYQPLRARRLVMWAV